MVVELLYFPGCPNLAAARSALQDALTKLANPPRVAEIDVTDPAAPAHLRSWGSPSTVPA